MNRKGIAMLLMMIMMLSGLSVMANGAGLGVTVSISTNKTVYVAGENITVYIHGENYSYYDLMVDGDWYDAVYTNATGYATEVYRSGYGDLSAGEHTIELEQNNKVLSKTTIEIREGLQLWPSSYTNSYRYLNGETLWVKLTGQDNTKYFVNITTTAGKRVYPVSNNTIPVTTDSSGIARFNISLNIGDGDYLLNLYNATSFIQSRSFSVASVEIVASLDKGRGGVYLLSEKMHVYVSIYWMRNHTLISGAQYKYWIVDAYNSSLTFGPYISDKTEFYTYTLDSYSTQNGDHIQPDREYYLKIEYQEGTGASEHMAVARVEFYTGTLYGAVSLDDIDGSYSPGNRVTISMDSYANYANSQVSALGHVKIDFVNITITDYWAVQWTHNWTDYGYTDVSGQSHMIWTIPSVPAGSKMTVTVGFSKGDAVYTASETQQIYGHVQLSVKLDKNFYISGERMKINMYTVQPANVKVEGYDVWIYSLSAIGPGNLLYYVSTNTPEVTYTVPSNYSGTLDVVAKAHFSTGAVMVAYNSVQVYYGYLYLTASKDTYMHAGDQIAIYSEFTSNLMHPNYIQYRVTDDHGKIIEEKNASVGEFLFTVPNANSKYYEISAEATYNNYRVYNSITIWKFEGYYLSAQLLTKSKYQNMVFEPGQTVKISYSVEKIGDFPSHLMILHWTIINTNYQWEKTLDASDMNGTISITIPSDISGGCIIELWVSDSEESSSYSSLIAINVEKGTWSMENVAGMPLMSLINLALVIIAIIIGIVAILLLRKGRTPPPEEPAEPKETAEEPLKTEEHEEKPKKSKPFFGGKKKKGPPKPFETPTGGADEPEVPHDEDEIGEL